MSYANPTDSKNAALASPTERRRNLRFAFSATVETVDIKSGIKVTGRTSDLGLGGCYVDTLSPFPVGTEAKMRILRENETFEAQVKVVYSMIGLGMGLAFLAVEPKQVRIFQRWLQELSGEPAPVQDTPAEDTASENTPDSVPAHDTQALKNHVLSDLIMTLMQKKVLTEVEGKDLLRKLFN
jgi:hypothetical protein